jgi:zinc-ribbon domain
MLVSRLLSEVSSMEFCTSCGTKLPEDAKTCDACGVDVSGQTAAAPAPSFLTPEAETPYPVAESKNGLALAGMILGIVGLVLSITVVFGIILGVLALIFGIIGRSRAKALPQHTNSGKALAAIILGAVAIGLSVLVVIALRGPVSEVIKILDVELTLVGCDESGVEAEVRWAGDGSVDVTLEGQALTPDGEAVFTDEIVVTNLSGTTQTVRIEFPSTMDSSFNQCFVTPLSVD